MGLVGPEGVLSSLSLINHSLNSMDSRSRNGSPPINKRGNSIGNNIGSNINELRERSERGERGDRGNERGERGSDNSLLNSSYFSGSMNMNSYPPGEPCDGSLECCLDFHETAPYTAAQKCLLANSTMQQGMAIKWVGEFPSGVAVAASPHPRTSPLSRSPAVLPSPAGISIMPATNTNSSSKYTPTLTTTSGMPLPSNTLLRNSSLRSLHGGPSIKVMNTMGYSLSSTASVSPHMSSSISRNGSIESSCLDKRALTERLQAVASYPSIEIGGRGGMYGGMSRSRSRSHSQSRSPKRFESNHLDGFDEATEDSERDQSTVDKQIEEVEAELEIARLEAKLLKLRNSKSKNIPSNNQNTQNNIQNTTQKTRTIQASDTRQTGRRNYPRNILNI